MTQTIVRRYEGDRALEEGINLLEDAGWDLVSVSSRKAALGFLVGPFASKSIHEAIFSCEGPPPVSPYERRQREIEWTSKNPRPVAPAYTTIKTRHTQLRDWEQRRDYHLAS